MKSDILSMLSLMSVFLVEFGGSPSGKKERPVRLPVGNVWHYFFICTAICDISSHIRTPRTSGLGTVQNFDDFETKKLCTSSKHVTCVKYRGTSLNYRRREGCFCSSPAQRVDFDDFETGWWHLQTIFFLISSIMIIRSEPWIFLT